MGQGDRRENNDKMNNGIKPRKVTQDFRQYARATDVTSRNNRR